MTEQDNTNPPTYPEYMHLLDGYDDLQRIVINAMVQQGFNCGRIAALAQKAEEDPEVLINTVLAADYTLVQLVAEAHGWRPELLDDMARTADALGELFSAKLAGIAQTEATE